MTNVAGDQREIAALTAAIDQVDISVDVWASMLSLAAVCVPALAEECIVELIQGDADLRRATTAQGEVTIESAQPLPTTRELMLSQAPILVSQDVVAVPVVSAPGGDPYVGVVTFGRLPRSAEDSGELLRELVRRVNAEINREQLVNALTVERERTANLQIALASNREIGMAMGIVMKCSGCTPDDAFGILRRTSQDANRKLRDVASDIVLTGDVPGLLRSAAPNRCQDSHADGPGVLLGAGHILDGRHPHGHIDATLRTDRDDAEFSSLR